MSIQVNVYDIAAPNGWRRVADVREREELLEVIYSLQQQGYRGWASKTFLVSGVALSFGPGTPREWLQEQIAEDDRLPLLPGRLWPGHKEGTGSPGEGFQFGCRCACCVVPVTAGVI